MFLKVIAYVSYFLATAILIFISIPYSNSVRNKYSLLKITDGKKHIFVCLIIFLYALGYVFSGLSDWKGSKAQTNDENILQELLSKNNEVLSELRKGNPSASTNRPVTRKVNLTIQKDWDRNQYNSINAKVAIVMEVADKAEWYQNDGGDYASYNLLWKIKNKDPSLSEFMNGELTRINYLLSLSYAIVSRIPLCKQGRNIGNMCLEVETEDNFSVDNVIAQLSHHYWISRAKSAYLLHFLTIKKMNEYNSNHLNNPMSWELVLDSLYKAFSSDKNNDSNNLLSRYLAWETFRKHTCFAKDGELFNVDVASKWWNNEINRKKVIGALVKNEPSPFCQQ